MDGLALVEQARDAGLRLWLMGGTLKMKGPKRLGSLVELISQNKAAVVDALLATTESPPDADEKKTCDSAKTSEIPENVEVSSHGKPPEPPVAKPHRSVHRLIGNDFPSRITQQPPAAILATPAEICPRCNRGRVLPELRQITGGRCWPCWEATR